MHDANVLPYGSDSEQPDDDNGAPHAETTEPYYVVGDTPAWRRTGITDRQAAGLDPSPHSDGFDADEHNRPRNGLGTYHESDGAW